MIFIMWIARYFRLWTFNSKNCLLQYLEMSVLVYYAPREEKTWTVHSSFYSRGACTIFRHNKRKVIALRLHNRA